MKSHKYHVYLTPEEKRILLKTLLNERNILIACGMFTDALDDLIIKITKARQKRLFLSA